MKLLVAGMVGVMVSVATLTGCGPGLSHREAKAPMTPDPTDVLATLNAELSQTLVGTTTTTSADATPLPEARMAIAAAQEPVVAPAIAPTWGAGAIAAEAAKSSDFDMHPYDRPDYGSIDQHPYE